MSEYARVYCRRCKRRHRVNLWATGWHCDIQRDDTAYCPKRKARVQVMRHERTGRLMPI